MMNDGDGLAGIRDLARWLGRRPTCPPKNNDVMQEDGWEDEWSGNSFPDVFDERAAIREYEGGMFRAEAERLARADLAGALRGSGR